MAGDAMLHVFEVPGLRPGAARVLPRDVRTWTARPLGFTRRRLAALTAIRDRLLAVVDASSGRHPSPGPDALRPLPSIPTAWRARSTASTRSSTRSTLRAEDEIVDPDWLDRTRRVRPPATTCPLPPGADDETPADRVRAASRWSGNRAPRSTGGAAAGSTWSVGHLCMQRETRPCSASPARRVRRSSGRAWRSRRPTAPDTNIDEVPGNSGASRGSPRRSTGHGGLAPHLRPELSSGAMSGSNLPTRVALEACADTRVRSRPENGGRIQISVPSTAARFSVILSCV